MVVKSNKDRDEAVSASAGARAASTGKADASAPAKVSTPEDVGDLVAIMSRLLVGFGRLQPLREAELGLGEWIALSMLARDGAATNKLMARKLGVPVKRVGQISNALAEGGLVSVQEQAEGEKTQKTIGITDAGKAKLEAVNSALGAVVGQALDARSLSGAIKRLKVVGRLLRTATSEKGKKARKDKQAAKAEG